jgi:hypothetical protein
MRVDELASRLGVAVHAWNVDGLGPARGFGFRAVSGRVYFLEELAIAVRHRGAPGPEVPVDAADLTTFGAEFLVVEVLAAPGLSRSDVAYLADESVQQIAAALVARVSASRAKSVS